MAMDYSNQQQRLREEKRKRSAVSGPRSPSAMSVRQRFKYIMAWNRLCDVRGWDRDDKDLRHQVVGKILTDSGGDEKRFQDFKQPDYNVVTWAIWENVRGREPSPELLKQVRDQEVRKNLLRNIDRLSRRYDRHALATLLRERFKCDRYAAVYSLPTETLEQLRQTLTARTYGGWQGGGGKREGGSAERGTRIADGGEDRRGQD